MCIRDRLTAPPDEKTLRLSVDAYYWQDGRWVHQEEEWYKQFEIQVSECLIATATYGSELSPELMFLRHFRDNAVLTTFTGRQFMVLFNTIYYSFSPAVASAISSNEALRATARVVLYPLMVTLHLGSAVYQLFSFNPELAVVVFCLTVTPMLTLIYIVPWTLLLSRRRKIRVPRTVFEAVYVTWLTSGVTLLLAIPLKAPGYMMAGGALMVVATMVLTLITAVKTFTRLKESKAQPSF